MSASSPCGLVFAAVALVAATSGAAAETIRIHVENLAFSPAEVSAHVGDTIEWVSSDFVDHTATARNKSWDVTIPANGSGRVDLTEAGTVEYYCRFHPNMVGHISVADK